MTECAERYLLSDILDHDESKRLECLEAEYDPITIARLKRVGIAHGWQCLEVGAGGGSITRWMANQVGSDGNVVAVDLDTRFLEPLRADNIKIERLDIAEEGIGHERFDLVHARFVLLHIPKYRAALQHMVHALKPGGWLLLEEPDFTPSGSMQRTEPAIDNTFSAIRAAITAAGGHPYIGRELTNHFQRLALENVQAEGIVSITPGDSPMATVHSMTVAHLTDTLCATGLVSKEELDEFLRARATPNHWLMDFSFIGAWGQKPLR